MIGDRFLVDTKGIWGGAPSEAVIQSGPRNPWQMATDPAPCLGLAHNNYINIKTGGLDDFSGYHTGCINLTLADGSVHIFRSITGDGQVRLDFWAIGTPSGGEVIQVLDY